ncbi:MAG: GGDEF domain-containing protein [Spirochaetales bacterium]|nr:GGDEF domain-containing protein [Spirochaetales bacterium]
MQKGIIFILEDSLNEFMDIFEVLAKIASTPVQIMSCDDFINSNCINELQKSGILRSIIIIEETSFKSNSKRISDYVKSSYKFTFSNYILINTSNSGGKEKNQGLYSENHFNLCSGHEIDLQANNLNFYANLLLKNSTLTDRLSSYISDSFKVVVYSELISKKNKEIEILNKELEKKNRIDNLTNIYNRSALFDFLEQERKRTTRDLWRLENSVLPKEAQNITNKDRKFDHEPIGSILDHFGTFSILMIDLDHFKTINDTYGHLAGDSVLKALGKLFLDKEILRENDIAGRFGGEEFIIILPETNSNNALGPSIRLAERFSQIKFEGPENAVFSVTLSIGISEFHSQDKKCEDIIARADKALYYAKEHGRNQIVLYEKVFL